MAEIKGITERDRPITVGWCGNDNCEHTTHKARRAAQAAADTRAKKTKGVKQGAGASA